MQCTLLFDLFPVIAFDSLKKKQKKQHSTYCQDPEHLLCLHPRILQNPADPKHRALSKTSEVLKSVLLVSLHSADGVRTGRPSPPVSAARESAEPEEEERQPAGPSPVIGSPSCAPHGSTPALPIEFLIIYMGPEAQWGPPGETRTSHL